MHARPTLRVCCEEGGAARSLWGLLCCCWASTRTPYLLTAGSTGLSCWAAMGRCMVLPRQPRLVCMLAESVPL